MNDLEIGHFRREIEILKICQHPNIIRLEDVFENADYIYIVLEYCDGGDLFSYLEKRNFSIKEEKAANIIKQLSQAISYLHSYGVIHRDIKPENILMMNDSDNAEVKILDFGLSDILNPGQVCNESYGTISYVAPEILLGYSYSFPADLWSIGVLAYLLLVGCLPFDHESDEREIARMTIDDPPNFTEKKMEKNINISKAIYSRALAKSTRK